MSVEYGNRALSELIRQAEGSEILLPNFQRSFVWGVDQQRSVATSILLDIPSGSLLLIRGDQSDYDCREIGDKEHFSLPGNPIPCEFLLDGQQRLTSLRQVFGDHFQTDWEDKVRSTFGSLKARWSLQIRPKTESDIDIFGYRNLSFDALPVEPDIVGDALIRHPILLTKGLESWFHPAFNASLGPNARATSIGELAALEGEVPLWGVLTGELQSVKQALKVMAAKRFDELKSAVQDKSLDQELMEQLTQSLNMTDPSEQDLIDELHIRRADWQTKVQSAIAAVSSYKMSTIQLTPDELTKAIVIFEAINRGGTPLTPFDLVSARYSKGTDRTAEALPSLIVEGIRNFPPRVPSELSPIDEWRPRAGLMVKDAELTPYFKNYFLQTLSASIITGQLTVDDLKQKHFLSLKPEAIGSGWELSTSSIAEAWRFLQLRCFVPSEGSLRNTLVLLPLALIFADPSITRSKKLYDRLEYWYWCSVLTSTYTSRQNENCVSDINSLRDWIRDSTARNPFESRALRVLDDPQYSDKETLLRLGEDSVGTDVGEYLLQVVSALGGQDLLEKRKLNPSTDQIEDHHLIPLGTATNVGQSTKEIRKGSDEVSRLLNSPINRAYVLKPTNQTISSMAIANYMEAVHPSVRASLHFTHGSFQRLEGEDHLTYARRVLSPRFDSIKTAVINRLSQLV